MIKRTLRQGFCFNVSPYEFEYGGKVATYSGHTFVVVVTLTAYGPVVEDLHDAMEVARGALHKLLRRSWLIAPGTFADFLASAPHDLLPARVVVLDRPASLSGVSQLAYEAVEPALAAAGFAAVKVSHVQVGGMELDSALAHPCASYEAL